MNTVLNKKIAYSHDVVIKKPRVKNKEMYSILLFTHKEDEEVLKYSESATETYKLAKEKRLLLKESSAKVKNITPFIILSYKTIRTETVFLIQEENCQDIAASFGGTSKSLLTDMNLSTTFAQNVYQSAQQQGMIICEYTLKRM